MKLTLTSIFLLLICSLNLNAQDIKIPGSSTTQKLEQDFGLGHITLSYSRPNVKGRKIFNGMEPYGIVWRMGANSATKLKITDTIQIEGHTLVPGEYSMFAIPAASDWTVIINKTADQWGAYAYDSTKDLYRFTIKAAKLPQKMETLTFQFANVFMEQCDLQLLWENTSLTMHLTTAVDARVMANIDAAMLTEKKPYYLASIYYYNHDKDINKALGWITEADKAQPGAFNMKYWKARIQLKSGDKASAIATAKEGVALSVKANSAEYIRLNNEVIADASK